MKFERVEDLYRSLDANNNYTDDDHVFMQVWARSVDALYVIRLGEYSGQAYAYTLPADAPAPSTRKKLEGVPFYNYEDGVFLAGYNWADVPDELGPYVPDSGEVGTIDIPTNLEWELSDKDYLLQIAEHHRENAAYELSCAEEALGLLKD